MSTNFNKIDDRNKLLEDTIKKIKQIAVITDRDNANVGNNFSAKLLRAASEINKAVNILDVLPEEFAKAHIEGEVYIHDLDSYLLTTNCLTIDLKKHLSEGFNTGYGYIRSPKRLNSAAELMCILLQSTQNDLFGGQSIGCFDDDLGDYAEMDEKQIRIELLNDYFDMGIEEIDEDILNRKIQEKLNKNIHQAMQQIVYNLNTMHSRAGSQCPFSSVNIGIPKNKYSAMICEVFLEEYDKGLGKGEQAIFPTIVFRVKDGVNREPTDPYYNLFQLACKVAANRMMPTFLNLDAPDTLAYYNQGIVSSTMGCRTASVSDINGEATPIRRGNMAPSTINLVRIGFETIDKTYSDFDTAILCYNYLAKLNERLEFCLEGLLLRYDILKQLKGRDLPFVIGQNCYVGSEEVGEDDSIEPVLKHQTLAIGFIGVAEVCKLIFGKHHGESEEAREFAYEINKYIREFCDRKTKELSLNISCYATPAEGLSDKFLKLDRARYGEIDWVTTKGYYTNSFHVPPDFKISMIDKLKIEAPFHQMCNGGRISYVEFDAPPVDYPEVVEELIRYSFTNTVIDYVGINFGIRYCKDCGHMHVKGNLCPDCNSSRIQGIYKVTGYLALEERFGSGKAKERDSRVSHN